MNYLITVVVLLLAALLQLSVGFSGLIVPPPDVMLVYLCLLLLVYGAEPLLWLSLLTGLLLDFFSGFPDGVMLLAVPLSLFAARYLGQTLLLQKYSDYLLPAYVILSTILLHLLVLPIQYAMYLVDWTTAPGPAYIFSQLPAALIWNLLTLPLVYSFNHVVEKILQKYWPKTILS